MRIRNRDLTRWPSAALVTHQPRRRRLSLVIGMAAALSAAGCSTSEPLAEADFCQPFEAAWHDYVDRRGGEQPADQGLDASEGRRDALAARDALRQDWNDLVDGPARPSAAVVESIRTLDRNLVTAWSGGGLGARAQADAVDSFKNGLDAVAAACARGGATVQIETIGVPLTGPTTPSSPPDE
jgi:hypothetical protein